MLICLSILSFSFDLLYLVICRGLFILWLAYRGINWPEEGKKILYQIMNKLKKELNIWWTANVLNFIHACFLGCAGNVILLWSFLTGHQKKREFFLAFQRWWLIPMKPCSKRNCQTMQWLGIFKVVLPSPWVLT